MRLGPGKKISHHRITWDDVKWAVVTCIGFYAPKMSALRVTGPNDGPIQFASIDPRMLAKATPDELLILERFFGRLQDGGEVLALPSPSVNAEEYAKTLN